MIARQPFVVLSAERSERSPIDNARATAELSDVLLSQGFAFKPVQGRYQGTDEQSFLVWYSTTKQLNMLRSLAAEFDQESLLVVSETGSAIIESPIGTVYASGQFVEVTERQVTISDDAYTQIGESFFQLVGMSEVKQA